MRPALDRLALLGKLAMAEVFLLAVILVGIKGVGIGMVEVTWGLPVFVAAVLLSLAASIWATAVIRPPADRATGKP